MELPRHNMDTINPASPLSRCPHSYPSLPRSGNPHHLQVGLTDVPGPHRLVQDHMHATSGGHDHVPAELEREEEHHEQVGVV